MKLGSQPGNQDRQQQYESASACRCNNFCIMMSNKGQTEIQSDCSFFKGLLFTQRLILLSGIDLISLWR
jgi:hypothetical protein